MFSVSRVEPDEDVWRDYVADLEAKDAATSATTKDEAIKNIQEAAQAVGRFYHPAF